MNEREVFIAARQIADPAERAAFLARECADDDAARARIEALLAAAERDDSFLALDDTAQRGESVAIARAGDEIGPYKLLELIGEGGFGAVFMAEQQRPVRRTVALKLIKPGMDSRQVIARFEAERQALAIMDHPCIARVFDAGTTESGRPYFVMELVKGVPITTFCDERRSSLRERLELFLSVCAAIGHAHSKGVIHRDIKPSNVLVALYDDRPVPKVIDFGVAKATGQQLTERTLHTGFGAVVGSLEYMSPEQASFNQLDVDTRSDVYALGVLLYELLTGSPPITADELKRGGLLECLRQIRESEPLAPSQRLSTAQGLASLAERRAIEPGRLPTLVRGELDWIALKALEKDRNRRYETVSALGDEIGRHLRGEAVLAHPPSAFYQASKWARRHRQGVAFAAVVLAALASLAFVAMRAERERERQVAQHSTRVASAIESASAALGAARGAPVGQEGEWVAARAAAGRLEELLAVQPADSTTSSRADALLASFREADADRRIAEQLERVVMMSATHEDLASWERMERDFRALFASQGMDFDQLAPAEVAQRIRAHPSAERLCDALELYIGTLGQMSALGGPQATAKTMQPWADAMLAADDDPLRSGIRRLMYSGRPPAREEVDALVVDVNLADVSPRTVAWLGSLYAMSGAMDECDRVLRVALNEHPTDFMLNFDFAYMQAASKNTNEAIRYYLRCTAIRPDVAGVWRALGNALRDNGELEASRHALEKSVELDATHAATHLDLAETCLRMEDAVAAERAARVATSAAQSSPRAQQCLARALLAQHKHAEALVALEECQRLNAQHPRRAVEVDALIDQCRQALSAPSNVPPSSPRGS